MELNSEYNSLERKQITVTEPAYNALKKMQYNPKTGVKRKIIDIVSEMVLEKANEMNQ